MADFGTLREISRIEDKLKTGESLSESERVFAAAHGLGEGPPEARASYQSTEPKKDE
jgi:hypothetical protein